LGFIRARRGCGRWWWGWLFGRELKAIIPDRECECALNEHGASRSKPEILRGVRTEVEGVCWNEDSYFRLDAKPDRARKVKRDPEETADQ
jgi:hypothetical protein